MYNLDQTCFGLNIFFYAIWRPTCSNSEKPIVVIHYIQGINV